MIPIIRSSCPVPYTCPAIDACKDEFKECLQQLSVIEEKIHLGEYNEAIDNIHRVRELIATYTDLVYSPLEELRNDNIKLREWGEEMEKKFNNLKNNEVNGI